MSEQFRNIDRRAAPQTVTVTFSRVVERDESAGAPDTMQDGFWPSRDREADGYVEPANFESAEYNAKERYAAWQRGEWEYVGVYCRAHVAVPIGGNSFTLYVIDGPGLWGIESDQPDYLAQVYEDQKAEFIAQLRIMGAAFVGLPDGE